MIHTRRMLLVEPEEYKALKEAQLSKSNREPDEIKLNKLNENLVKNKIIEENKKGQAWSEFGSQLKPIISESITNAKNIAGEPASQVEAAADIYELIRSHVPTSYITKVTRLYNLLSEVDGISIDANQITVDGSPLFGLPVMNMSQLVRPNRYLSFNLNPLLNKIKDIPQINRLIANKDARNVLDSYLTTDDDVSPSTPPERGQDAKRTRSGEPVSIENQSGSGLKKTKKIIWHSLF